MQGQSLLTWSRLFAATVAVLVMAGLEPGSVAQPQIEVHFTKCPPARVQLLVPVEIAWEAAPGQGELDFRTKLDAPGDWMGGISYALRKWSDWGPASSVLFRNFVAEGSYKFTVQARRKGSLGVSEIVCAWSVYWEFPEVRSEKFTINWQWVNSAQDPRERYRRLAKEYDDRYRIALQQFEYESRMLKLTTSPEDIVAKISATIVGKADDMLLTWADASVAAAVNKILLPQTIYALIKEGVVDLVLIYRNVRANQACSMAVVSYYASHFYARRAQ